MEKTDNPQAFPAMDTICPDGTRTEPLQQGVTTLDYFAAKAMQGFHYSGESKIAQVKTFLSQNLNYHSSNVSASEDFKLLDFLRSKGYATEFMGIPVEEWVKAGVVKLKEV
jgi:hypothetical protein